jgi:hypothetical protein
VRGYNILPAAVGQYSCRFIYSFFSHSHYFSRFSNIGDANTTRGVTPATYVNSSTLTCGNIAQTSAGVSYLSVTYQNLFFASEYVPINHYGNFTLILSIHFFKIVLFIHVINVKICHVQNVNGALDLLYVLQTLLDALMKLFWALVHVCVYRFRCLIIDLVSINPARSHVSGNTTVFVRATQFVSGISYYCDFGGELNFVMISKS